MICPAIDKNNIVIGAKFPAQMGGGNYTPAAAAQDYNSFFFVQ